MRTPRKPKTESPDEFDFRQDNDDADNEDDPFEKLDMFVKSDPLGGLSNEKRLQFLEDYLSMLSEEASKLARKTGLLIKTTLMGQRFHSTAINEITDIVGLKSSKFLTKFDFPTVWSTLEALGNSGQNAKMDIPSLVSTALKSE